MDFGFTFIHQLAGASKILDGIGIFCAEYLPYIIIVFFVIALFARHTWRERISLTLFTALSVLVASGLIKAIINYLYPIDRPFVAQHFTPLITHAIDPSFPSGHAVFFFTIATVVFMQMSARWGIVAYLAAILIGIARIFVGVHYPVDILGGAVIGMLVPLLVQAVVPQLSHKKAEQEEPMSAPTETQ